MEPPGLDRQTPPSPWVFSQLSTLLCCIFVLQKVCLGGLWQRGKPARFTSWLLLAPSKSESKSEPYQESLPLQPKSSRILLARILASQNHWQTESVLARSHANQNRPNPRKKILYQNPCSPGSCIAMEMGTQRCFVIVHIQGQIKMPLEMPSMAT